MKKTTIRKILNDIKAAVRLGQPEAIQIALEGVFAIPQVAANDQADAALLAQFILPAGEILARLPAAQLRPLLEHPTAALRAISASALARRYLLGKDVNPQVLRVPAGDVRPDVRTALGATLREAGEAAPEHLLPLMDHWLKAKSPRMRETALNFIPALAASHVDEVIAHLHPLSAEDDRAVRAALVDTLHALAERGMAQAVLGLLTRWGNEPAPNIWVITRSLSYAWATAYPQGVASLLRALQSAPGSEKPIQQTLDALARHGVQIEI
ncbi:MAG: hypothetical protein H8E28_01400 [Anaerolineae bacterium]|nr:hypothetical protein [Anaerolineae bacterium]